MTTERDIPRPYWLERLALRRGAQDRRLARVREAEKLREGLSETRRAAHRRFSQSATGRDCAKRYRQSEVGKATAKRYRQSEAGRATAKRYRESERGKARALEARTRFLERNPTKTAEYSRTYRERHEVTE